MQYMAWPDHGVPDDSSDFLNFVNLVRSKRGDSQDPVVVHCRSGPSFTSIVVLTYCESIKSLVYIFLHPFPDIATDAREKNLIKYLGYH